MALWCHGCKEHEEWESPSKVIISREACCGDSISTMISLTSCDEDYPIGDLNDHMCCTSQGGI